MSDLLKLIIIISEKAANIARACRQEEDLFKLLVQEKSDDEANPRFIQDFKTLADVLVQETVRHEIGKHFPLLANSIKGEEINSFTNSLGETISIEIKSSVESTAEKLEKILDGDTRAANILATEVHRHITIRDVNIGDVELPDDILIDIQKLGIWIDPIDSTAEYIKGHEVKSNYEIYLSGLQCVTVLIGAYDSITGLPVMGVINQPFTKQVDSKWEGKCYWGISTADLSLTSVVTTKEETKIITLSRVESNYIKGKLQDAGYILVEAAGAGYKLLSVITGLADAYILSQGTTFKWDVCGPHAIIRAIGGRIVEYESVMQENCVEITYKDFNSKQESKINKYCNRDGIVAAKNRIVLEEVMEVLSNFKTTTV